MTGTVINVVGGGLAGCEAAWRAASRGVRCVLWEMKPVKFSPAHRSPDLAELVCSNSFRASSTDNAVGLLKEEMRRLGSVVMDAAARTAVPAGKALAVDRERFSRLVTETVEAHPLIEVRREELTGWPETPDPVVMSPGPLASEPATELLGAATGKDSLSFYDALAPIVTSESLDMTKVFSQDRYGPEGGGDYLNAPLEKAEFLAFLDALVEADRTAARSFEDEKYFEGCLPIEVMATRGPRTLTFGPMKPVGLTDPRTGRRPYAAVQLRRENLEGTLWNIVGFQTRLTRPAQDKVFRMIPGLERCEFARYGAIHRNTFLSAPDVLDPWQRLLPRPSVFMAGQISGVEGYVESAAQGLWAGENAARTVLGIPLSMPPRASALGSLVSHLRPEGRGGPFAPSNVNFGLFPALPKRLPRSESAANRRRESASLRAEAALASWTPLKEDANHVFTW
ncbi:MAG: methylenetetrahydrofolate--tRNA-(uracil(54)-C(5))-methyltransferase (FADH(2)-oxidizing) TrmFO [Deltaproteobacteria bacterium]|jgi:methylenetetrahydrofolate--tRNA-(uracil-5-)-methyltransferase|nr:methylenetetrahydrofolate--tRNA-(uracil(54)-C(5))-methyltransferase (FADH(2)-oxidizing) TrmFO [Deltaproteobacteria bacterium]